MRIDVFQNHHRAINTPRGPEIRYTLDLTRMTLSSTRQSQELLERLTGITIADPDSPAEEQVRIPGSFPSIDIRTAIPVCDRASIAASFP
jgi:hypothetical protein